ncbi:MULTISPECIES: DUF3667 domain-containing protein [unclassified Arcicella]|uniref:DUF3667 domain-containing protein n=1 Tax=unclassified Arcicella TaxID=2644986 RepID=UPI002860C2E0|nr:MULTISPECIES: DUF3667 domain-containing protein [unclassified Arcicella]MDR6561902.1 hypothetical protein [Arcicella sp. BE51]MDR6814048.1 hypothetical protein [Arcicella sp. BE140]MDR6825245.1 hypothetical protein [Arcicella sp. BE139]
MKNEHLDHPNQATNTNVQEPLLKRVDRKYAAEEFLNLIGYERGFLFTVRELLLRPSKLIHHYLNTDRNACTKPVTFLFLCSVIYSLITSYLEVDVLSEEQLKKQYGVSGVNSVMLWVQNNYGYANILMLLFITFWTKIFFKKCLYNIYEIGVLLCFIMGEGMLWLSIHPIVGKFVTNAILDTVIFSIIMIYISWAIGQFFGGGFKNYLKALFAYLLGFGSFEIVIILIGVAIDLIGKKI